MSYYFLFSTRLLVHLDLWEALLQISVASYHQSCKSNVLVHVLDLTDTLLLGSGSASKEASGPAPPNKRREQVRHAQRSVVHNLLLPQVVLV